MITVKKLFLYAFLVLFIVSSLGAQEAKKPLTLEDYPLWKHVVSPLISADGKWVSYSLRPNGGDITLFFKEISSKKIHEIAYATRPQFSEDGRWAAYQVGVSKKEAKQLQKEKKPIPTSVELLQIASGEKYTIKNGASFAFSKDSQFFAVKTAKKDKEAKHEGTDLVIRNLNTGMTQNIGNVAEYVFNKSGHFLAYTIDAADKQGNGIYLLQPATGLIRSLDTGEALYSRISWDRNGRALAVLKGTQDKKKWERDNILLAFLELEKDPVQRYEYNPIQDSGFPEGMVLSERVTTQRRRGPIAPTRAQALIWSEDLSRIFCGIKEQETKAEKSEDPLPNVDIWHWKDERIQSVQQQRFQNDVYFTYRSVFLLKTQKFLCLADENMRTLILTRDGQWAVGRDEKPYLSDVESMADYYLVNCTTGERSPIVKGIRRTLGVSPQGLHFLYLKEKHLHIFNFVQKTTVNITASAPVSFVNEEDDHPSEKPPYGLAGWAKDGKSVIVNHKYDLWMLPLVGKNPLNITKGMGDQQEVRFRYIRLDPEERFIDTNKAILLSAYGDWTKKSGYFSLKVGESPRELIFLDKSIGSLRKAKNAAKLMFTQQTFVEFPNYYVSEMDFKAPQQITDANPQQKDYIWGRRILVDYTNSKGQKLQGTLTLPGGYEEGKKYPMVVYFYEKMSQRHHQYSMPTYDDRPHMSTYASNGYLVLMPDIVFEIGRPGSSSLDCVSSAAKKVIELGYADPERIGLQGHSWGGFQTSFIVTQTDMFACVVSGAPPTCIEGEFNQVFKGSGNNNHSYYSRGQGRMGTNPWEDHALYRTQSAIQNAANITTPFMLLHGTEDGSVDWIQSLEYYNAARFLGKNVIFLSYPGEPHHLAKEENQKDFQNRMQQYFDHYLKGAPMSDWMKNGVPYMKKKRILDAQKDESR